MKSYYLFFIFPLWACQTPNSSSNNSEESKSTDTIAEPVLQANLLWATDTVLTTVESVIYDSVSGYIYTTNIEGHFMDKDGQGSISKLDLAGNIIERNWVSGLDAPTGTAIYDDKLYVTDIDRLIIVDIASGNILHTYPVDEAKAFNDIAIGPDGEVYASDTGGNQLFELRGDSVVLINEDINTPNGLLHDGQQWLVTCWTPKSLYHLNHITMETQFVTDGIAGPDGLEVYAEGEYLVSSFAGKVYHVNSQGNKQLILDTSEQGIKAADIDYIPEQQLLLVPTMDDNRVMAYRLTMK